MGMLDRQVTCNRRAGDVRQAVHHLILGQDLEHEVHAQGWLGRCSGIHETKQQSRSDLAYLIAVLRVDSRGTAVIENQCGRPSSQL